MNSPVILFCVLLLSGLDTLASCAGPTGFGAGKDIGDRLNAAGMDEAGTRCHANLCSPGKGISFAKSKPHR